jgi:hypothetical protein
MADFVAKASWRARCRDKSPIPVSRSAPLGSPALLFMPGA